MFSRSSIWTAASTAVALSSGFISQKLYGLYLGPDGLAYLANFINLVNLYQLIGTGGQQTGLIAESATARDNQTNLESSVSSAITFSLLIAIVAAVIIITANGWFSQQLFGTNEYGWALVCLSIMGIFIGQNLLCLSVMNGKSQLKFYAISLIAMNLLGLVMRVILIKPFGMTGAILSTFIPNSLILLLSMYLIQKDGFNWRNIRLKISKQNLPIMYQYLFMSIMAVGLIQISQFIVRNTVIHILTAVEAGYWQAVVAISSIYNSFLITLLGIYYVPRMAPLKTRTELINNVGFLKRTILPGFAVCMLLFFLLRHWVIDLLYAPEFSPATALVLPLAIGDFARLWSWLYAYMVHAKRKSTLFVMTEIAFHSCYWLLALLLVQRIGVIGVAWAYATSYLLYLAMYAFIFYRTTFLIPAHENPYSR